MNIAIDIREALKSKRAGKGWYTFEMVQNLLKFHPEDRFILYTDQPYPEWEHFPNAVQKFFPPSPLRWHFTVLEDLKRERPDIYFAPSSYIIPSLAPKWLNVVATVHDLVAWLFATRHNMKATIIERITLPLAIKKITKFVAVSENTKRDLHKFFQTPSWKTEVIPCGVGEHFKVFDDERRENFRGEKGLPEKFILAVGTLEPRKNFVTLIRAFAEVAKKFPDYTLVIVGGKGWYFEKIFSTVRDLGMEDRILFTGYVEDRELPGYYNTATCFVFPSLYEGFGIPLVEAMKSGCPVITSNISSMPEVVDHAAILVNPTSPQELAHAMESLIGSPEKRAELREKGLHQSQKFSWRSSSERLYELFQAVVKGHTL